MTWATDDWHIGFRSQAQYAFTDTFAYTLGGYHDPAIGAVADVFVAPIAADATVGTAATTTPLPSSLPRSRWGRGRRRRRLPLRGRRSLANLRGRRHHQRLRRPDQQRRHPRCLSNRLPRCRPRAPTTRWSSPATTSSPPAAPRAAFPATRWCSSLRFGFRRRSSRTRDHEVGRARYVLSIAASEL